jgi:hypothetical protein|tara:strand:+ start:1124 stop:1273 length:150 start_codon:yes stop_codon:yes gene_type:complete
MKDKEEDWSHLHMKEHQGRSKKQVESNYAITVWTLIIGILVTVITCSLL